MPDYEFRAILVYLAKHFDSTSRSCRGWSCSWHVRPSLRSYRSKWEFLGLLGCASVLHRPTLASSLSRLALGELQPPSLCRMLYARRWSISRVRWRRMSASRSCSPSIRYSVSTCRFPMPASKHGCRSRNRCHQLVRRRLLPCVFCTSRSTFSTNSFGASVTSAFSWHDRRPAMRAFSSANIQSLPAAVECLVHPQAPISVVGNSSRALPHSSTDERSWERFCRSVPVALIPSWLRACDMTQPGREWTQHQESALPSPRKSETSRQRREKRPRDSTTCCSI